MLRIYFYFIILALTVINLQAKEINYINTYSKLITNNLKLVNLDDENAEFKMEKKQETFDYALRYKLGKAGYEDSSYLDYHNQDIYNEDSYNLLFSSSIYLYDYMWLNFNMNYKDSIRSTMDTSGGVAYKKKSVKEESAVKLYFKPNSIIISNISFENLNNSIDYDKFVNQSFKNTNNKKLSLNVTSELGFATVNTSFYQIIKDNNYLSLSDESDDYLQTSEELYRGLEFSLSKDLTKDLKVTTTAKVSDIEVLNSNLQELIGNVPTYSPQKELDLKAEYLYKDVKFISKVTYVGSRYSDNLNSEKLNSYAIGSLGAIFFTKINDEDVKVDLSIKNILNKDYYIYSDTKGDSTNFMMNMSMQF
jgi:iron complex outermembrane receptor protein